MIPVIDKTTKMWLKHLFIDVKKITAINVRKIFSGDLGFMLIPNLLKLGLKESGTSVFVSQFNLEFINKSVYCQRKKQKRITLYKT